MAAVERSLAEQAPDPNSYLPPTSQPPFDNLATEILQIIFKNACPNVNLPAKFESRTKVLTCPILYLPQYLDPMALAMVCKRWRDITATYHSLWATLVVSASRVNKDDWSQWGLSQLRDRLGRSGTHPLRITVESEDEDDEDDHAVSRILDLVMLHSERWHNIKFEFALKHQFLQKLATVQGRLPLLESLDIDLKLKSTDGTINCPPFLAIAPSLRHLVLSNIFRVDMTVLQDMQLPWAQISDFTLQVSDLTTKQELQKILLWLSGSLTALTFFDDSPRYVAWSISENKERIALPKLKQLQFFGISVGILDMLICPMLQQLDIDMGDSLEIVRFLDRSSCSLTNVHLHDIRVQENDTQGHQEYSAILQHSSLSTVESLSLTALTDPILDILVSRTFFPYLGSLSLDLSFIDLRGDQAEYVSTRIEGLQTIIESRACATNLDHHNPSIGLIQPTFIANIVGTSLKNYSVSLFLPSHKMLGSSYSEIPLQRLRSCCEARNVRVSVEVLYNDVLEDLGLWPESKFSEVMDELHPILDVLLQSLA